MEYIRMAKWLPITHILLEFVKQLYKTFMFCILCRNTLQFLKFKIPEIASLHFYKVDSQHRQIKTKPHHLSQSLSIWACCLQCVSSKWSGSSPVRLWCVPDSTADLWSSPSKDYCEQITVRSVCSPQTEPKRYWPFFAVPLIKNWLNFSTFIPNVCKLVQQDS